MNKSEVSSISANPERIGIIQPRVARGTRPPRLPWVGISAQPTLKELYPKRIVGARRPIQPLQGWTHLMVTQGRSRGAEPTLGYMIATPLGLKKFSPSFPNSIWERNCRSNSIAADDGHNRIVRAQAFPNRVWEREPKRSFDCDGTSPSCSG